MLLLSGPKTALEDATTVLRQIDCPAQTIHLEILLVELSGGDAKALDGIELSGTPRDVKAKVREANGKAPLETPATRIKKVTGILDKLEDGDTKDDLWSAILRRKGGQYELVARMPLDPSLN